MKNRLDEIIDLLTELRAKLHTSSGPAPKATKATGPTPQELRLKRNQQATEDYKAGMKLKDIAAKHGITESSIYSIVRQAGAVSMSHDECAARNVMILRDLRLGMSVKDAATKYELGQSRIHQIKSNGSKGKAND